MIAKLYVFALLGTLVVFGAGQIRGFCHLSSCKNRPHTLCTYPFSKVSDNCGKVATSQVTYAEAQELVRVHNSLRRRVASGQEQRGNPGPQPASSNLEDMTWDDNLAGIAQTWADQCMVTHDSCRDIPEYQVGQNLAWKATTAANTFSLTELVQGWYNEVDKFDGRTVGSYIYSEVYGHYTQLVWAKSLKLGCGVVRYNNDGKWNSIFLVCNYGPAGNLPGAPVYETA